MIGRKAHTLVELCVTLSLSSALLILVAGLLHQSFTLASTARSRADHHRQLERLAADFRRDVHLADDFSIADPQHLELTTPQGSSIRYEADGGQVRRRETVDGQIVRQEAYPLTGPLLVAFENLETPRRLAITVQSEASAMGTERVPPRQMVAVLGRRLAHQLGEVSP